MQDDEELEAFHCGATACVSLITGATIYCANAGDTRCILMRGKRAIALSNDHKPDIHKERTRIEAAQHEVSNDNRVDGQLAPSRALGDFFLKNRQHLS